MSTKEIYEPVEREWWARLGLSAGDEGAGSVNDRRRQEARVRVLRLHEPSLFAAVTNGAPTVPKSLEQVAAELDRAEAEVEAAIQDAARQREQRGREAVASAFAAPDADELVTEGDWVGFTRARAVSWCWDLYQYEPQGFVSPGSMLREQRTRELEAGGIPNGFGYADRARQLEASGVTPSHYRAAREMLGSSTFSAADIQFDRG
ncbi:hypothetical protein BKA04_000797 [Cryobacterium mesophilum]|uniref:Uncharacterized protein n=1 Tax=Terrimesophilobacter mesophilus TaxID=433647 RepID=A0A4R8VBA9_9MICO|nr:hypothetical protein [Terrimesophilobacter mesophilus]MBB5632574.1 hypothetical protein [Terrimesophilobacter mesophilus]TFB79390.1 hypothetical protein E3N84_04585 [Terrimesophilobacter mesophilus]